MRKPRGPGRTRSLEEKMSGAPVAAIGNTVLVKLPNGTSKRAPRWWAESQGLVAPRRAATPPARRPAREVTGDPDVDDALALAERALRGKGVPTPRRDRQRRARFPETHRER
jgi:hypothetical protein